MTQNDTNFDPTIFPDPTAFEPERWTDPNERKRLSKYLQPFGRGTRICLGMELAYADIFHTVAVFFSPKSELKMELFETTFESNIEGFHDFFSPFPRSASGVKVLVK
jgi:hypothetical protein